MAYGNASINRDGDHIGKIVLYRMISAFLIVFTIWNPTGYSYVDWVLAYWGQPVEWMMIIIAGVGLLLGSWLAIAAIFTFKRLPRRTFIGGAVLMVLIFLLLQWFGRWDLQGAGEVLLWISLTAAAALLALGLSWREINNYYDRRWPRPRRRR